MMAIITGVIVDKFREKLAHSRYLLLQFISEYRVEVCTLKGAIAPLLFKFSEIPLQTGAESHET